MLSPIDHMNVAIRWLRRTLAFGEVRPLGILKSENVRIGSRLCKNAGWLCSVMTRQGWTALSKPFFDLAVFATGWSFWQDFPALSGDLG